VRSDQNLPTSEFRNSAEWEFDLESGSARPAIDRRYSDGLVETDNGRRWYSFSGHERDHFFVNRSGQAFDDVSALSGLDNVADGRGFAIWDFDHDGWQDVALVNANKPLLNIYRNQAGSRWGRAAARHFVAVRLHGGNRSARPMSGVSNRDAIGARIIVTAGNMTIRRELRCGEGFATQNSSTMIIGIGDHQGIDHLKVVWPSGQETNLGPSPAGMLITIFEDSIQSPTGHASQAEPYQPIPLHLADDSNAQLGELHLAGLDSGDGPSSQFYCVTTMATWCEACKKHLPQLAHLRETFSQDLMSIVGVPVDPVERDEDLQSYIAQYQPAYELIRVGPQELTNIQRILQRAIQSEAIPATIVLDSGGRVMGVFPGVPNASSLRRLF
jgi:hypothetical protein